MKKDICLSEPPPSWPLTQSKPSTVKLRLKELVEKGCLLPKGQGRGAHYVRESRG